jgi:hypothetical protein
MANKAKKAGQKKKKGSKLPGGKKLRAALDALGRAQAPKLTNSNTAPPPKRVPAPPPAVKQAAKEKVCSLTNPFCVAAQGARLPDPSGAQTMTQQVRQLISMPNTNAAGNSAIAISPTCYTTGFTGAAATLAFSGQLDYKSIQTGTTFQTNVDRWRVISFGAIVRSTGNSTQMAGNLIISNPSYVNNGGALVIGSFAEPQTSLKAIATGLEVSCKAAPFNAYLAKQLVPYSALANSDTIGWPTLLLEVTGAAVSATPYITVEVFINFEYTVIPESVISQFLPGPVTPQPQLIKAVDAANTKAPLVFNGGADFVDRAFQSLAQAALDQLGSLNMGELLMGLMSL